MHFYSRDLALREWTMTSQQVGLSTYLLQIRSSRLLSLARRIGTTVDADASAYEIPEKPRADGGGI